MKQDVVKIPAQPVRLVDLIGYQDGSVVSRTIIEENTATVTLFAFAEGQGLSEHTVPFDALVHVIDGEAEVTLAAETFRLKTGEVMIMPVNKPHALKSITRFKMILTMVRT